jgi:hypothetical protein
VLLRAVGQQLDALGVHYGVIDAAVPLPEVQSECQVQVLVASERVLDERDVQFHAQRWSALYPAS